MSVYLVTLSNGEKIEIVSPDFMRAAGLAVRKYREENPDAPEHLGMSDIEPIEADDIISFNASRKEGK